VELVLTHNNIDFDSLAAAFGVTKLYPSARIILGLPLVGNVRDFLVLYRSSLPIAQIRYVDLETVRRVFLVDCQHAERLDDVAKGLISKSGRNVPYTIFDHHELDPDALGPGAESDSIIQSVGAATTLVVEQIRDRNIPLTPFEASLLALGIYEDTGCLTYGGVTDRDASCVAFLLQQGAELTVVNDFMHSKLSDEQQKLFQDMVRESKMYRIHGAKVVIAKVTRDLYIDGLATLTRKLVDVESADSVFTVARMRDRVHIVGRSDSRYIDVRAVVRKFGGDGHPGAGSAVVRGGDVDTIAHKIEELARSEVPPQKVASEIMSTPVRTIVPSVSMDEANRIMIRHGLDGLIVAEQEKVIGVVSRRDVDQAMHHKLGHAPVLGFMSKPVISVPPETPLNEMQHLMILEDIGRLPVIDNTGRLLGVVSRHNVLKTLYGGDGRGFLGQTPVDWRLRRATANFSKELSTLSPGVVWLSKHVGEAAAELNMVAYAVGGFVRDLNLGIPNFDLDYVIEGDAIQLAEHVQSKFPDKLKVIRKHDRFHTATLEYTFDGERSVDFSTARTEFYEYPAALPTVERSKLDQDLMRRDFTINAMAICLNPDRYGELIDEFGGLDDLKQKIVRVLHPFSFIEDPTRIIRAVRFAARLGFKLNQDTAEQAKHAISIGIFDNLGGTRIRDELRSILESPHRLRGLELLSGLGAKLRYLDSDLEYTADAARAIRRAERLLSRYPLDDAWTVYLGLLISTLSPEKVRAILDRLHVTNDQKQIVLEGLSVRHELPQMFEEMSRNGHGLKNSEIYHLLHGKTDESLAIVACLANPGSPVRRMIKLYMDKLEKTKPELTGKDLISLGFKEGPQLGVALSSILDARLDGFVKSRNDEVCFIKQAFADVVQST